MRRVTRKVATMEDGLVWFGDDFTMGTLFPDGWTCIWHSNNRLNKIFPFFNPLSNKISPGSRLIDIFSSHFSFHSSNQKSKDKRLVHIHKLEEHVLQTSANSKMVVVVSDTSIKNHIAISIAHVYSFTNPIIKILHYVINITTTEAKLFAIKCSINQAV